MRKIQMFLGSLAMLIGLFGPTHTSAGESEVIFTGNYRFGLGKFDPDAKRLAYISKESGSWQIWVMNLETSTRKRITQEENPVGRPSWANEDTILYYVDVGGRYGMKSVDVRSAEVTDLSQDDLPEFRPSVSSRGELLFDRAIPGGEWGTQHDIIIRSRDPEMELRLFWPDSYESDALWSPDEDAFIFHSDRGEGRFETGVYIASVFRLQGRLSLGVPERVSRHARYPAWHPAGTHVAYVRVIDNDVRYIVLYNLSDRTERVLSHKIGWASDPEFHPDGQRILFVTKDADNEHSFVSQALP